MIMQDRAKRTMFYHDLGKDAKNNQVLDKRSMVASPFFWEIRQLILNYSRAVFGNYAFKLQLCIKKSHSADQKRFSTLSIRRETTAIFKYFKDKIS